MSALRGLALGLAVALAACSSSGTESTASSADSLNEGHRWKVLNIQYQAQPNGYWCGPAATRIALSARMNPPSHQDLANQLGTTVNGTDWIGQVTNVLNRNLGNGPYETRELPNDPPTPDQKSRFWRDIVSNIDSNYAIVANIVAPPGNQPPGYPGNQTIYHYVTVIGYNPDTWQVFIADPANFGGHSHYWLTFDQLSTLVPPKGYAAARAVGTTCPGGSGATVGMIDAKYRALGGCGSILGVPVSDERATPDNIGRYSVFERGSIYWTEALGANEVHGVIRDKWAELGWEPGVLGYPVSDERKTPDGAGRYNVFERGSVYWTEATGAHEVLGRIRDQYAELGWEAGALGYPVSGEKDVPGGKRSDFQHGSITWKADTNEATVTMTGASGSDGGTEGGTP